MSSKSNVTPQRPQRLANNDNKHEAIERIMNAKAICALAAAAAGSNNIEAEEYEQSSLRALGVVDSLLEEAIEVVNGIDTDSQAVRS